MNSVCTTPNDMDAKVQVSFTGGLTLDPETGLSKEKPELTVHTATIGKTSDGMKN